MTDDRILVAQVLSGDKGAFRTLIKMNERLVGHMISRLIDNDEEREELCQDTFIKVYQKLKEFNFQSRLSTWIATIAWHHAINHLRKRKIEVAGLSSEESWTNKFIADGNPEETLAGIEMNEMIHKLIQWLPVHYRTVLTLYHLDDMNYAEIGNVTGMPEGTVKNYLFRARHLLKEKVKQYLGNEQML